MPEAFRASLQRWLKAYPLRHHSLQAVPWRSGFRVYRAYRVYRAPSALPSGCFLAFFFLRGGGAVGSSDVNRGFLYELYDEQAKCLTFRTRSEVSQGFSACIRPAVSCRPRDDLAGELLHAFPAPGSLLDTSLHFCYN